jgi:hypothetical protein
VDSCETEEVQIGTEILEEYIEETVTVLLDGFGALFEGNWIEFTDSTIVVVDVDTIFTEVPIFEEITTCIHWYHYGEKVDTRCSRATFGSRYIFDHVCYRILKVADGIWLTRQSLNMNYNTRLVENQLCMLLQMVVRTFEFSPRW